MKVFDAYWPPAAPSLEDLQFTYKKEKVIWHDHGSSLHPALTTIDCRLPPNLPVSAILTYLHEHLKANAILMDLWRITNVRGRDGGSEYPN